MPATDCPGCGGALRPRFEKDGRTYTRCQRCGTAVMDIARNHPPVLPDYLPEATLTLPATTRKRYRELLEDFASYRTTGLLLDVGCGTGFFVQEALAAGWKAAGTEISPAALAHCRARGIPVHEGPLAGIPVEPGAVDVMNLVAVIEHVPEPDDLLLGAARLLRPGGALYVATPNFGSLSRRLLGADWAVICREHFALYTAKGLLAAVRRTGFRPVHLTSRNIIPHEIRMAFRGKKERTGAVDPGKTASLQARIESKPSLRLAKKAVNTALSLTGLGDTLYLTAVREP